MLCSKEGARWREDNKAAEAVSREQQHGLFSARIEEYGDEVYINHLTTRIDPLDDPTIDGSAGFRTERMRYAAECHLKPFSRVDRVNRVRPIQRLEDDKCLVKA